MQYFDIIVFEKKISQIPETEWAYLAGIIDGEGCITVEKRHNKSKTYWLQIRIIQKNHEDLLKLAEIFGGTFNLKRKQRVYQLYWGAQQGNLILRHIYRYLKWKKDEAELAIAFISQCVCGRKGAGVKQPNKKIAQFIKDELSAIKKVKYA